MLECIVVHDTPAWRDRANFLLAARINLDEPDNALTLEQLWARQLSSNTFEICCIPFFVYDLALGDHVTVDVDCDKRYLLKTVVHQAGHFTFRAWFNNEQTSLELPGVLERMGCGTERRWQTSRLLAIDAESDALAQTVADLLYRQEQSGLLVYETGRSS
jgi:hypothetical protein